MRARVKAEGKGQKAEVWNELTLASHWFGSGPRWFETKRWMASDSALLTFAFCLLLFALTGPTYV
jgi:hypothetical protein